MTTQVVGPFYLSRALGLDTALVGVVISVGPIVAAVAGVPAGGIVDRLGTQRMTVIALTGLTVGAAALSMMPATFGVSGYIACLVVITAGYALFQAANNTAVMADIRPDQRGVISGMLNLARNLGLITGASVMGAIFALASATTDITSAPAEAVASGMRITFAVAAVLMLAAIDIANANQRRSSPCACDAGEPDGPFDHEEREDRAAGDVDAHVAHGDDAAEALVHAGEPDVGNGVACMIRPRLRLRRCRLCRRMGGSRRGGASCPSRIRGPARPALPRRRETAPESRSLHCERS
jgi:hypothetical protein